MSCCEEFRTENKFQIEDGEWVCGDDAYIFFKMRFCPFCGTQLKATLTTSAATPGTPAGEVS